MHTTFLFHLNLNASKNVFALHLYLFSSCYHSLPGANRPGHCSDGLKIILFYIIDKINWMIYPQRYLLPCFFPLLLTGSPGMIATVMAEMQCLHQHIRPNDSSMSLSALFATISLNLENRIRMAYFSLKEMLSIAMDLKCLQPTSKQNSHQHA